MRSAISKFLLAAAVLLTAVGKGGTRAEDVPSGDGEARLLAVDGTVMLHPHNRPEGEFSAAEADESLEDGDGVRTGADGTAEVSLDGQSLIEVGPDSYFIAKSLAPERTLFQLSFGHLIAKTLADDLAGILNGELDCAISIPVGTHFQSSFPNPLCVILID